MLGVWQREWHVPVCVCILTYLNYYVDNGPFGVTHIWNAHSTSHVKALSSATFIHALTPTEQSTLPPVMLVRFQILIFFHFYRQVKI